MNAVEEDTGIFKKLETLEVKYETQFSEIKYENSELLNNLR